MYGALDDIKDEAAREALRRYLPALSKRTGTRWTVARVSASPRYRARLFGVQATVRFRPERRRWEMAGVLNGGVWRLIKLTTGVDPSARSREAKKKAD